MMPSPPMLKKLRQVVLSLTMTAQARAFFKGLHDSMTRVAKGLRDSKDVVGDMLAFVDRLELHRVETSEWIEPDAIVDGRGGPFDARDLRIYLALAERVGIPIVPAREILRITDREYGIAGGPSELPQGTAMRSIQKSLRKAAAEADPNDQREVGEVGMAALRDLLAPESDDPPAVYRDVMERAAQAMDDVPEGWMVRSNLCGPGGLKGLAGSGLAGPESPEVRFGRDVEVGPGWVRVGNRRKVDLVDHRQLEASATGAKDDARVFLARPWVKADRFLVCPDPHREDTPLKGAGTWPAEWRAFVERGEVRGVSFYYSWAGEATPRNARMALEVRRLAQMVADEAKAIGAWPRAMTIELVRADESLREDSRTRLMLERFPRDDVAFTLDFIEAEGGLMLLEGGPAHTPIGMGHSCGFTGVIDPSFGNCMLVDGVAFRTLPGVNLVKPETWSKAGPREGCILTWEETNALASS